MKLTRIQQSLIYIEMILQSEDIVLHFVEFH